MKMSQYNIEKQLSDGGMLLMNTRSGGVLSLNSEYVTQLRRIQEGNFDCAPDLVDQLKRGDMIIDDEREEYKEVIVQSQMMRFSRNALNLTIAPTMACNFCCPYCYEKGRTFNTMSSEIEDAIVSFVNENFKNISELFVGWYGGEPLLAIDLIEELTKRLKDTLPSGCSYRASIVTNGYLLTQEMAKRLIACSVVSAQVTLDGSKELHDSRRIPRDGTPTFERILKNVGECCDLLDITVRSNVDKENINSADELLKWFEKYNLKDKVHFYLAPVDNVNEVCFECNACFTMDEFSEKEAEFYRKAQSLGFTTAKPHGANYGICGAVASNAFVIDPLGDIYKCWDDIGYEERKVGNVKLPLMLTPQMVKWLSYTPGDEECRSCPVFPVCMGGCPNYAVNYGKKRCNSLRYNAGQKMMLLRNGCRED